MAKPIGAAVSAATTVFAVSEYQCTRDIAPHWFRGLASGVLAKFNGYSGSYDVRLLTEIVTGIHTF